MLKNQSIRIRFVMAGVAGFEPTMNGSEPFALPLGDTPTVITSGSLYSI